MSWGPAARPRGMGDVSGNAIAAATAPNAVAMGVSPDLEPLAALIVAANDAHYNRHDDNQAQDLLNQFWTAKSAMGNPNVPDVVFLDAHSHRLLAYILWYQSAYQPNGTPIGVYSDLGSQVRDQFAQASAEFAAAGYPLQAQDDAGHAGQAQTFVNQTAAVQVDDSYLTAFKDAGVNAMETAQGAVSGIASGLAYLSNPWVLGGAAVVLLMLARRR